MNLSEARLALRQAYAEKKAQGFHHVGYERWINQEEFDLLYKAAVMRGMKDAEDYRDFLVARYSLVPSWVPEDVRRSQEGKAAK